MEKFVRSSGYGAYPDLSSVRSVLVIHFKNIGDMVLSLPVIDVLRRNISGAAIDFMLSKGVDEILSAHPDIRELIVVDKELPKNRVLQKIKEEFRAKGILREKRYDLVVVLNPGKRGERYAKFCKSAITVGLPTDYKRSPFQYSVMPAPRGRHYVERHLDVLRKIGLFPLEDRSPRLPVSEKSRDEVQSLLKRVDVTEQYIVIHPCSRWMFKSMSPQLMGKLIERVNSEFDYQVLVTAGPADIEKEYVRQVALQPNVSFIDLSGCLSLLQLAELLRDAKGAISIDTAAQHIAAAVGVPIVAIFGPTDEIDWGVSGKMAAVIASDKYSCRPCNRDGCGGSKVSECMDAVDIDSVVMKLKAFEI